MFKFNLISKSGSLTVYDAYRNIWYYISRDKRLAAVIGPLDASELIEDPGLDNLIKDVELGDLK